MGQFSGKGPTAVWNMNPSAKGKAAGHPLQFQFHLFTQTNVMLVHEVQES